MSVERCTNPGCQNKDYLFIIDINILTSATEAFAKKILDEQQGTADLFLETLACFIEALARCTLDGTLHTTEIVWQEYRPERSNIWRSYRGHKPNFDTLRARLDPLFTKWPLDPNDVGPVRRLPPVPKSENSQPGNNDLTLLALTLTTCSQGMPTFLATMDEALYDVTRRVSLLGNILWDGKVISGRQVGYQTGLIRTESTHRCCHISTPHFETFQNYVLYSDMMRMDQLVDEGKKQAKVRDHLECVRAMSRSIAEKAVRRAALQASAPAA
jgi:hypothetical protein